MFTAAAAALCCCSSFDLTSFLLQTQTATTSAPNDSDKKHGHPPPPRGRDPAGKVWDEEKGEWKTDVSSPPTGLLGAFVGETQQKKKNNSAAAPAIENSLASSTQSTRDCGDLTELIQHIQSIARTGGGTGNHPKKCVVCGGATYTYCAKCGENIYLHYCVTRGEHAGSLCFYQYHSSTYTPEEDKKPVAKNKTPPKKKNKTK